MTQPTTAGNLLSCDAAAARLLPLSALLAEWAADAEASHEAYTSGVPRGAVTGFPRLDRELGTYLAPGLHVLHGEPGTGKTALALQLAATCGVPAVFVTTEMAPLELLRRIAARVTGTFLNRFRTGELSPAESCELAARAAASCPLLAIMDATLAYAPPETIEQAVQAWQDRHAAKSAFVAVDSVHSWAEGAPERALTGEYEGLNLALYELQRLSSRLSAPVLGIAERNRMNMGSGGQSAAAGTRRFEYTALSVLALQRDGGDGEWCEDVAGEYPVVLKLAKNRNGRTGPRIEMRFHGALQSFREL